MANFKLRKKERNTFVNGSVWWKYVISVISCLLYLAPIYVAFVVSMKPMGDNGSRLWFTSGFTLETYLKALNKGNMLNAIKNSAIITLGVVVIEVILGCFAAYPIARNRSKFNKLIKSFVLGIMMIPALSMVVGVYQELVAFKMVNTYWGIIIVSAAFGLPLSIYLYSNFIGSIPISLDEAAAIDGAGAAQTFFKILLPQLKPVTVSVIIMKGIGAWNEYAYSLYILQKNGMKNITLAIKSFFGDGIQDYGTAAAAAMIGVIPVIVIYLSLQQYFVQGTLDSAVKG